MNAEDNKVIVRRWFEECFNEGNLEMADELFAPDHVIHHSYISAERLGADPMKTVVWLFHKTLPDLEVVVEDEIAEGEKVVSRWAVRGTRADELRGADFEDEVTVSGISIFRISDGEIKETWLSLEAELDESQMPMPTDEIREWLLEETSAVGEATLVIPPDNQDEYAKLCCRLYICCGIF
jgi:predicted SnoaL-like aldol condensation-catalyzing enzyme